ncbi:MAG: ABC transporter ATP-binding protein [Clostridia bacterium]|nr:ABC transporter ATP-binding protein [Clostridia bacterium]
MSIKLQNVTFSYKDTPVLKNFSLEVKNGETVALKGESGSGKTSIARLVLGLEKANEGKVTAPEKVAAVFQEDRLLPTLTVRKNVSIVAKENDKTDYLLKMANLDKVADKKVWQLSGGMKRRVAILRAINFGGEALILDEAFNGLDPENKRLMAELIKEEYKKKPILLISHINEDADLLNARTVTLEKI